MQMKPYLSGDVTQFSSFIECASDSALSLGPLIQGLFNLPESELDPKPVSVVDLVSNQTVELKSDS